METRNLRVVGIALAILFVVCDVAIGYYIFGSTVRDNGLDWELEPPDAVSAFALEGTGASCIVSTGSSLYFHYKYSPVATKSATFDAPLTDIAMSNNRKYFCATDANDTLHFLAYGSGKEFSEVYTADFGEQPRIAGLVVIGKTLLTTRLLVYTTSDIYLFNDSSAEPLWHYETNSPISCATISHYGDVVAVGLEDGTLMVFDTFQQTLLWECTCDASVTCVNVSPFAYYLVAGTSSGNATLYSMEEKMPLWSYEAYAPVECVYLRSSASEVCVLGSDSHLAVLSQEGTKGLEVDGVEQAYMPYWGEFIGYVKDKCMYQHRTTRNIADWKYCVGDQIAGVEMNYGGESVMASTNDSLMLFEEDQLIIMGSRSMWSVLALLVVMEVLVLGAIAYRQKGQLYIAMRNMEVMEFFVGAAVGIFANIALNYASGAYSAGSLAISASAAGIASWQFSRSSGGIAGVFIGFMSGFFCAMAVGGAFGIYYWLAGSEQNIFSSFFGNIFFGGLNGTVYSLIGIIAGLVSRGIFTGNGQKRT